jgi:hypothetical protein
MHRHNLWLNDFRVFFALAFCAASVGQTSAYMQDYTKAKHAADLMFELIEQVPDIDEHLASGSRPVSNINALKIMTSLRNSLDIKNKS